MMNYNGTADTANYVYNYCQHRLPCGYCEKTGLPCYINGSVTYAQSNRSDYKND